jgi:hypothetical protein
MLNEKTATLLKTKIATTSSTQKNQAKLETFQIRKRNKNKPMKAKGMITHILITLSHTSLHIKRAV